MRRIDTPTAAQDLFGPGKHGFRNGDPANAVLATRLNAEHFNAVQEEIAAVVEGSGAALNPADNGQLFTAIKSLFRSATLKATELLLGVLRVGTQVEVNAGELDDVAVTPKKLRFGFVISLTANGYIIFPTWMGGLIIQWGQITTSAGGGASFNWPIAFPNSSLAAVITGTVTGGSIYVSSIFARSLTGFSASTRNNAGAFTAEVCSYISIGY